MAVSKAKYLQVFLDLYTTEFPSFATLRIGRKYRLVSRVPVMEVFCMAAKLTFRFTEASELRSCWGMAGHWKVLKEQGRPCDLHRMPIHGLSYGVLPATERKLLCRTVVAESVLEVRGRVAIRVPTYI